MTQVCPWPWNLQIMRAKKINEKKIRKNKSLKWFMIFYRRETPNKKIMPRKNFAGDNFSVLWLFRCLFWICSEKIRRCQKRKIDKRKMGDRLVWKRGRESQNDTGPSSSGKFETADKTSGHVSIQPDDFSRTMTHYCPFRENRKINKLRIENTQSNLYFFFFATAHLRSLKGPVFRLISIQKSEVRIPDGRRLYTVSCCIRTKWPSERRIPLY